MSIQRNYQVYLFSSIFKRQVYLELSQTFKMEPFVKIINDLMLLNILTKSSILDVWLVLKIPLKASIKVSVSLTFLALASIWLNIFSLYFVIFISSNAQKLSSSFVGQNFYVYSNKYLLENIHKYSNFSLSPRQNNGVWWFQTKSSSL